MSGRRTAYARIGAAIAGGGALGAGSGIACARFAPGTDQQAVVAAVLLAPLCALFAAGWVGAALSGPAAAGRMLAGFAAAALLAGSLWVGA